MQLLRFSLDHPPTLSVVAVIALLAATSSARAEAIGAGVGVRTCAQFAKDYKNAPENTETVYNNWALGFLTGFNVAAQAADRPQRDLEAMSFEDKKQFIRDYCDQHPLQPYLGGVIKLLGTLPVSRASP